MTFDDIFNLMDDRCAVELARKRALPDYDPHTDIAYGSYIAYGRTLFKFAADIGDLCNFGEPAKFVEDDLYEFWTDDECHYGLINLSRAHREAQDRENNYRAFMSLFVTEVAE